MPVAPMDVPELGRMCIAQDPTGAVFGAWQAVVALGKRFYAEVFGYRYAPVEAAPAGYETFQVDGGDPLGGIGGVGHLPAGTPSHRLPYVSVADVDASVTAAQAGGGTAVMAGEDTPGRPDRHRAGPVRWARAARGDHRPGVGRPHPDTSPGAGGGGQAAAASAPAPPPVYGL